MGTSPNNAGGTDLPPGHAPWGPLPELGPKEHAYVPEQIAQTLRQEIADGRIPPGTKLPEVLLSDWMRVSRHTMRAAFHVLEEDGVARRVPNRGVFVASPSVEDVREIYRVRRVIEPGVVRAAPFDADDVDDLQALVERARLTDLASLAKANQEFHRRIIEQARSELLRRTMDRVLAQMQLAFSRHTLSTYREFRERHIAIIQMLRGGETELAARALEAYLGDSEQASIAAFGADEATITRSPS